MTWVRLGSTGPCRTVAYDYPTYINHMYKIGTQAVIHVLCTDM